MLAYSTWHIYCYSMSKPKPAKFELLLSSDTESEVSHPFLQGMVNRMMVSFHKYGGVAMAYPKRVNAIDSLQQRVDKYADTGNTEFLIDVANFAMIEFMHPAHPHAFFEATDSDQSPGRTTQKGEVTISPNHKIKK